VYEEYDDEVSTQVIGQKVSDALKTLDHVAFVRFASVYRDFKDVTEFLEELLPLVKGWKSQEGAEPAPDGKGADPGPAKGG
jgi:transcriptional repressor NrdR